MPILPQHDTSSASLQERVQRVGVADQRLEALRTLELHQELLVEGDAAEVEAHTKPEPVVEESEGAAFVAFHGDGALDHTDVAHSYDLRKQHHMVRKTM